MAEWGEPPIMVERDADCSECGQRHDIEKCPKCGAHIEIGFGLAFGGFGTYKYCSNYFEKTCDWFWKETVDEYD